MTRARQDHHTTAYCPLPTPAMMMASILMLSTQPTVVSSATTTMTSAPALISSSSTPPLPHTAESSHPLSPSPTSGDACFISYLRFSGHAESWRLWHYGVPLSFPEPPHETLRKLHHLTRVELQLSDNTALTFHLNFKVNRSDVRHVPNVQCGLAQPGQPCRCGSCVSWVRAGGDGAGAAPSQWELRAGLHLRGATKSGFQSVGRGGGSSDSGAGKADQVFTTAAYNKAGNPVKYDLSFILPSTTTAQPFHLRFVNTITQRINLDVTIAPDDLTEEMVGSSSPPSSSTPPASPSSSASSDSSWQLVSPAAAVSPSSSSSSSSSSPSSSDVVAASSSQARRRRVSGKRRRSDRRLQLALPNPGERVWCEYWEQLKMYRVMWSPLEWVLTPLNFHLFRAIMQRVHRFHRLFLAPKEEEHNIDRLWRAFINEKLLTPTTSSFRDEATNATTITSMTTDQVMSPDARYKLSAIWKGQRGADGALAAEPADPQFKRASALFMQELDSLFKEARQVVQPGAAASGRPHSTTVLHYGNNHSYERVQGQLSSAVGLSELRGMTPMELSIMDITVQLQYLTMSAAPSRDEKEDSERSQRAADFRLTTQRFLPVDRKLWLMGGTTSAGHILLHDRILPQFERASQLYGEELPLQYRTRLMRLQLEKAFHLTHDLNVNSWPAVQSEVGELTSKILHGAQLAAASMLASSSASSPALSAAASHGQRMGQLLEQLSHSTTSSDREVEVQRRIARGVLHQMTSFCLVAEAPFQPPWPHAAKHLSKAEALFSTDNIDAKGVAVTQATLRDLLWYEHLQLDHPVHITRSPHNDYYFLCQVAADPDLTPFILAVEQTSTEQCSRFRLGEQEHQHASYRFLLPRLELRLKQLLAAQHRFSDGPRDAVAINRR